MKEYGGYIEFENYYGTMLHENAIALNCGRNALAYLCETKKINKLYLPYFLCSSVPSLCEKSGVKYEYYRINERFEPVFQQKLGDGEWLYIVNFYGQLDNNYLSAWKQRYDHVIVDHAQSYYQMPVEGVDTLYTCRKYFGVADGAFLYTDTKLDRELPQDESFNRMHFLLGRYERTASEFYSEYAANNHFFANEPIKRMSKLTENLLHGIDYARVKAIRTQNFAYLHEHLGAINQLTLTVPDGAFMYPLYIENGAAIRKILQAEKIYVPILWPNVMEQCPPNSLEYHDASDILPIPVDQRYNTEDMKYMTEVIKRVLSERARKKGSANN